METINIKAIIKQSDILKEKSLVIYNCFALVCNIPNCTGVCESICREISHCLSLERRAGSLTAFEARSLFELWASAFLFFFRNANSIWLPVLLVSFSFGFARLVYSARCGLPVMLASFDGA